VSKLSFSRVLVNPIFTERIQNHVLTDDSDYVYRPCFIVILFFYFIIFFRQDRDLGVTIISLHSTEELVLSIDCISSMNIGICELIAETSSGILCHEELTRMGCFCKRTSTSSANIVHMSLDVRRFP
jgi:hypothetical protein